MAISKRPQRETTLNNEEVIKAVINKGGSVPNSDKGSEINHENEKDLKRVQLRLSGELINLIDKIRNSILATPSRHQWILEAIAEKIERDSSKGPTSSNSASNTASG